MKLSPYKDIRVPVQVVLGETSMSLEDFSSIKEGSIVELDTFVGEPVSLCASGEVIAKGEVVVVDEYYGIRVSAVKGEDDG